MLFIGVCKFLIALTTDFIQNLECIDVQLKKLELGTDESYLKQKQMFHDIIKFHANMKQLSDF